MSLPTPTSIRVAELLPGDGSDPIVCQILTADFTSMPSYEAISYAWGDVNSSRHVICDGKVIKVTENLYSALIHLRFSDKSRYLWADALCINQDDIPERGLQVRQMQKIYRIARKVLIWLGPDSSDHLAEVAISSIFTISNFLCEKLDIPVTKLGSTDVLLQEIVSRNRARLPIPSQCDFNNSSTWNSLRWLYSHPYFQRVWAIQEIAANKARLVYANQEITEWERVELVACYIIMETAFSKEYKFSSTYCWWAASSRECARQPKNWLFCLYLASNYLSTDARDYVYGLRGLMDLNEGGELLNADYTKSVVEVYRDSVEAALVNFKKTDVLLYLTGNNTPSWIPRWDKPMLFRNPFRFGKPVPWKPAGETSAKWSINKHTNVLSLTGYVAATVSSAESYNESIFGNALLKTEEGKQQLRPIWRRILAMLRGDSSQNILSTSILTAAAVSLSFGLDEKCNPAEDSRLLENFRAYLVMVLEASFSEYVTEDGAVISHDADGDAFGKPVWDFDYPESSIFRTNDGLIGCCTSVVESGDIVFIPLGSTYPLVLRPQGEEYIVKGYTYTYGIMHGELQEDAVKVVDLT